SGFSKLFLFKRSVCIFKCVDSGFRVGRTEHGITCDQDVGARFDQAGCVLQCHSAVDLDQCIETPVVDHPAQVAYLLKGMGNEFLTAETGVDAHHQHSVQVLENIAQQVGG